MNAAQPLTGHTELATKKHMSGSSSESPEQLGGERAGLIPLGEERRKAPRTGQVVWDVDRTQNCPLQVSHPQRSELRFEEAKSQWPLVSSPHHRLSHWSPSQTLPVTEDDGERLLLTLISFQNNPFYTL